MFSPTSPASTPMLASDITLPPRPAVPEPKRHRLIDAPLLAGREYPACFDSRAQYRKWARLADITDAARSDDDMAPAQHGICADCTAAFQQKMKEAGRCARPDKLLP